MDLPWWVGPAGTTILPIGKSGAITAWPGLWLAGMAALAAAVAIRLMDEQLDKYGDELAFRFTVARFLGDSTTSYALLAFCLSALLAAKAAAVLFLAAYAVGMTGDWQQRLPSGLPAGLEIIIVILIGIWGTGPAAMIWGFCFMAGLQCLDDYVDLKLDALAGQRNLCRLLGSGETLMIGIYLLVCAFRLSPGLTAVTGLAAIFSYIIWATSAYWWRMWAGQEG